jgi:SAM-dependent methyltransferase
MGQLKTLEEVNREGRERLYPSITNPSWLILRKRRELFQGWLARLPQAGLSVLDVGGRVQPYRPLLANRLRRYVATDTQRTPVVDLVSRGEQLPLADGRFDLVLCTQVLEYVPEPQKVITEIHRVLKPGGFLLLSVPAVFPRDADHECWRFLPRSLELMLSSFRRIEIAAEGSSALGFFRTINICIAFFAKPAWLGTLLRVTLVPVINLTGLVCENVLPNKNTQFTANYSVLAQK